jgi:ubiquinone/menaquinone biosynthesis C-methylase UbiE
MNEINQHYDSIEEKDRLSSGVGLLERERTKQIILRYIDKKPAKILDAGGAAGVYSFWLADLGYEVHLGDASPKHIQQAKEINEQSKAKLASIAVIDARNLGGYADDSMDCILLFGPLYHLVERNDRWEALSECFRVLKRKGKLMAAGINKYASLYDGLSRGLVDDPYFLEILKEDLKSGQHRNPKNHPDYFTTTIFQLPGEMEDEIRESRFSLLNVHAVEGPLWMLNNFDQRWQDQARRKQMFYILDLLEQQQISLLTTHHYIVVAEKS